MKNLNCCLHRFLIGFFLTLAIQTKAFAQDWIKLENDNFIIYSALSEEKSKDALKRMMLTDYMLRALTGTRLDNKQNVPMKVILPKNVEDLDNLVPGISENVGGFYSRGVRDTFFISPGLGTKNGKFLTQANETVSHEYTHYFQYNYFADAYPVWFVEGLAGYVGPMKQDERILTLGWPSVNRVTTLTHSRKWMSVEKMFNSDLSNSGNAGQLYAMAWLTTHYLMSTDEKKAKLAPLLAAYEDDSTLSDGEFEAVMGMNFKAFDKVLAKYFRKGAKTWSTPTPHISFDDLKISPLSIGDSEAFLIHQGIRIQAVASKYRKRTLRKIEGLIKKYPDSYNAQYALAGYHAAYSPIEEGLEHASRFAERYPNVADAHILLGQTYIKAHKQDRRRNNGIVKDTSYLSLATPSMERAITLDPNSYQAQFGMASVLQGKRSLVRVVRPYMERAHLLAPQVDEITLQMGRNYINSREYAKGLPLIERVARSPHNAQIAKRARAVLEKVKQEQ